MKRLICILLFFSLALTLSASMIGCALFESSDDNDDPDQTASLPGYTESETETILLTYNEAKSLGYEGTLEQFLDIVKGKDGTTPTVEIDAEGYWVINGVKTNTKATGIQGEKGETGAQGPAGEKGDVGAQGPEG